MIMISNYYYSFTLWCLLVILWQGQKFEICVLQLFKMRNKIHVTVNTFFLATTVWLVISDFGKSEYRFTVDLLRRVFFSGDTYERLKERWFFLSNKMNYVKHFHHFRSLKWTALFLDWQVLDWISASRGVVLLWVLEDLVFTLILLDFFIIIILITEYFINHMIKWFTHNYISAVFL